MWTSSELTSAAEHDARLGVIWSVTMLGLPTRAAAPHRVTTSPASSTVHRFRGQPAGRGRFRTRWRAASATRRGGSERASPEAWKSGR